MTEQYWLVLPAAGIGSRMQADRPKQYLSLNQRLLIDHTLEVVLAYPHFAGVVLVLAEQDPYWQHSEFYQDSRLILAKGGAERCDSVLNGLLALQQQAAATDWVLVHDVARPCIQHQDLDLLCADTYPDGALLATPVRDTMKRSDASGVVSETVERTQLWHALTPQKSRFGVLLHSLQHCLTAGVAVTDEASALEYCGYAPKLIAGRGDNIKVTHPDDLALAHFYLSRQQR